MWFNFSSDSSSDLDFGGCENLGESFSFTGALNLNPIFDSESKRPELPASGTEGAVRMPTAKKIPFDKNFLTVKGKSRQKVLRRPSRCDEEEDSLGENLSKVSPSPNRSTP